jgi:hypothetical protein
MGEGAVMRRGARIVIASIATCAWTTSCARGPSPDRSPIGFTIAPVASPASPGVASSEVEVATSSADEMLVVADDGSITLPIPDRKQHALSPKSGWCGETAIQEALLHEGMWAPQRSIHAAGKSKHPDLYSDEIPVALAGLGVRFAFYAPKSKGFSAYRAWIRDALTSDQSVLAGVKILPTEHPDWGLDHFVLVVGEGKKGLLVNTTWGRSEWVPETTKEGLSFEGVYYGIRILGLILPNGGVPARLEVLAETATDVKAKLACEGLAPGTSVRIERRKHASDAKPEWSQSITAASSRIEAEVAFDADTMARFHCAQE